MGRHAAHVERLRAPAYSSLRTAHFSLASFLSTYDRIPP